MEIVIVYGFMLLFIFSLSLLILLPAYLVLRKKRKKTNHILFIFNSDCDGTCVTVI